MQTEDELRDILLNERRKLRDMRATALQLDEEARRAANAGDSEAAQSAHGRLRIAETAILRIRRDIHDIERRLRQGGCNV